MDIEKFEKDIKKGLHPVYTFAGDQPFLLDMMVEAIKEKVAVGAFADMNQNTYHAGEKGAMDQALVTIEQLPMMAKMRLVVIREAEQVKGKHLARLEEYLLKPNDFCCLVLCFSKLKKNGKIWKRSGKNGTAMALEKIYERQMPFWIKRMAVKNGKKINSQAIDYLVRAVGADLSKADMEMEKAALYAGRDGTIEPAHLDAVLAAVKTESIFEFTDAIGKRDIPKAFYLTKKMLDAGEQPLRILWQVGNHMKRLMLVRSLLVSGAPASQIGRAMGVMDFVRDKLIAQAKMFSRKELRSSLVLITKTDLELKSGRISGRAILEKLILDLCGKVGVRKKAAV